VRVLLEATAAGGDAPEAHRVAADGGGWTPAHEAAYRGQAPCLRVLLGAAWRAGGSGAAAGVLGATDAAGATPVDVADGGGGGRACATLAAAAAADVVAGRRLDWVDPEGEVRAQDERLDSSADLDHHGIGVATV